VAGLDAESQDLTAAIAQARGRASAGEKVDVSSISTSAARPGQSPRELADRFDVLVAEYQADGLEGWEAEAKAEDTMREEVASAPPPAPAPGPEPLTEPSSGPKPRRSSAGITALRGEVAALGDRLSALEAECPLLGGALEAETQARELDREQIDEMLTVIATTIRDLRALIPPGPDAELSAAERAAQPMLVLHDGVTYEEAEARVRDFYDPPPPVGKVRSFFRWLW
jgi:hypothetical protein